MFGREQFAGFQFLQYIFIQCSVIFDIIEVYDRSSVVISTDSTNTTLLQVFGIFGQFNSIAVVYFSLLIGSFHVR